MIEPIVKMGAKLDRRGGRSLRKALKSVLNTETRAICFDASSLQHADAAGFSELFAMIAEITAHDCEAVILGASPKMLAIFELVQLDCVVAIRGFGKHTASMYPEAGQQPEGTLMFTKIHLPQWAS